MKEIRIGNGARLLVSQLAFMFVCKSVCVCVCAMERDEECVLSVPLFIATLCTLYKDNASHISIQR